MTKTIFVADDEKNIRDIISCFLENAGYNVRLFETGDALYQAFQDEKPNLIVLDVIMPGTDGMQLCKIIREESDVPIIILSAKDSEADRIEGIQLGGDDYLTKPFSPVELIARIESIFRRINLDTKKYEQDEIVYENLVVDRSKMEIRINGEPVEVSPLEFGVINYLAFNHDKAVSREELLKEVWNITSDIDTRATDDVVKRLRKKLINNLIEIKTVWGHGYILKKKDILIEKEEADEYNK